MADVKIWDADAEGGPAEVTMTTMNAREAIERDPKRYSETKPTPKAAAKPAPAPEPQAETPEPTDPDTHSRKSPKK